MIVLTGATGTTGRELTKSLMEVRAEFRCIVRDQSKSAEVFGADVETVTGDLTDPASIEAACDGADTFFLLSPHSPQLAAQQSGAIDAAKRAGVTKIVKFAGMMTDPSMLIPGQHVQAENHLKDSGTQWTIIRPCFFTQNLMMAAGAVKEQKKIMMPFPADIAISMIDVRDSGEACAKVLTNPGHQGQTYELTGPPVTLSGAATALSEVLGEEVIYVQVPLEAAQARARDGGAPDWAVEHIANIVRSIEAGDFTEPRDDISDILG